MFGTKPTMRLLTALVLSATVSMLGLATVFAQEHPEHPTKKTEASGEHPEHPEAAVKIDKEAIAAAITSFVESDSKLKGGYFLVFDPVSKSPLQLTLTKVHKERLAQVGENLFFACSDFDAKGGKVYDLDFFMAEKDGQLVVTEVMVHKEDGQARYSWFQEDELWKRKSN